MTLPLTHQSTAITTHPDPNVPWTLLSSAVPGHHRWLEERTREYVGNTRELPSSKRELGEGGLARINDLEDGGCASCVGKTGLKGCGWLPECTRCYGTYTRCQRQIMVVRSTPHMHTHSHRVALLSHRSYHSPSTISRPRLSA